MPPLNERLEGEASLIRQLHHRLADIAAAEQFAIGDERIFQPFGDVEFHADAARVQPGAGQPIDLLPAEVKIGEKKPAIVSRFISTRSKVLGPDRSV